jgi:hypothetical protein
MDRPQLIRRLRIAVSMFFAVVAVALCVLWVRSYEWRDNLYSNFFPLTVMISSQQGRCAFVAFAGGTGDKKSIFATNSWQLTNYMRYRKEFFPFDHDSNRKLGFDCYYRGVDYWGVFSPHWFLAFAAAVGVGLAWKPISTRFSLRTLLVVTTLVAVVLALGVWAAG